MKSVFHKTHFSKDALGFFSDRFDISFSASRLFPAILFCQWDVFIQSDESVKTDAYSQQTIFATSTTHVVKKMREKGGEAKALQIGQYIENRLLIIY